MEAIIINFRRGRHTQNTHQIIIEIDNITDKKASAGFIGRTIVWTSPAGKEIRGKISAQHGTKGALRVILEKGLPGQAIGAKIKIED